MTHLSDFSYLQRCGVELYLGIFLLYRIWSSDRMKCLHPKKIISGELRSIITVIYIIMLLMQLSWDGISTWIKYSEGFIVVPTTGQIFTKPFQYWTEQHKDIAVAIDYVECVTLSMLTGVFFLLQCFWNYLSNMVAKKSFMGSWEFKFYIFWALASAAVFPILQWYFRDDVNLREGAPQLTYSIEVLITSFLGIRSHFRFRRILNISRNMKHGSAIVEKLAYFKDMNIYFSVVLFFYGASLAILCLDGLTEEKLINTNKFASDVLIANCNTCTILMWIVGISIFHPHKTHSINNDTSMSRSMTTNTNTHNAHNQTNPLPNSNGRNTDLETNSNYNNINTSSNHNGGPFTDNLKVNGHRLSQRITNFIENRTNGAIRFGGSNDNLEVKRMYGDIKNNNGSFMRPMSPVEVDYPVNDPNSARYNSPKMQFNNNVSVDDPYSQTSVNFTMVEPIKNKKFNQQQRPSMEGSYRSMSPSQNRHQDYPMQTMSSVVSQRQDFRFDPMSDDQSYDYLPSQSRTKNNNYY